MSQQVCKCCLKPFIGPTMLYPICSDYCLELYKSDNQSIHLYKEAFQGIEDDVTRCMIISGALKYWPSGDTITPTELYDDYSRKVNITIEQCKEVVKEYSTLMNGLSTMIPDIVHRFLEY